MSYLFRQVLCLWITKERREAERTTTRVLSYSPFLVVIAGIAEPEKTSVARQWLCKHDSTATKSRDRNNRYTRDYRGTVGSGIFYWACAEAYQENRNWLRHKLLHYPAETRVEAGSNTSTVNLRVVAGDEKGSLKSETVKYGRESQGTRTRERLRWLGPVAYTKDRFVLSSERAPHKKKTVSNSNKYLVMSPRWGSTPRLTHRLTVSRNVTLTMDRQSHCSGSY
jgi:hypothetical protein